MDAETPSVTLETIALTKFNESLETKRALERARRRQDAQNAAASLMQWSGLEIDPLPDDYPFKWQGYWFVPDGEGPQAPVEMYAWDSERGFDWYRRRSIFEIGERIADWQGMDLVDQVRSARVAVNGHAGDYLPDSVRALLIAQEEA